MDVAIKIAWFSIYFKENFEFNKGEDFKYYQNSVSLSITKECLSWITNHIWHHKGGTRFSDLITFANVGTVTL